MATYAIGDIQGCFDALQALLLECGFNASRDRLWFVGDLVNRGAQSLETLRFVKSQGEQAITVLGNHDLHLIMVAAGFGRKHQQDTLDAILQAPEREELLTWLRHQPLLHHEDEYVMVHAGLLPRWSITQARDLAAEVAESLQGPNYRDLLANLYGGEPSYWDNALRGWNRLRAIVNAMTRMRFCTADGVMEFHAKGGIETAPPGYMPWFAVPGRVSADHTIIVGHWSALGFRQEEKLLGLDSGCLWGGTLTAVRLEDRRVFQYQCPRLSHQ